MRARRCIHPCRRSIRWSVRERGKTQVLEFIDMEHTPKNILLRAVKNSQSKVGSKEQIAACKKFLGVEPMLGALLDKGPRS